MEKLRIASIGVGRMGICHAETVALRVPDAELVTVCDLNEELARSTAQMCIRDRIGGKRR